MAVLKDDFFREGDAESVASLKVEYLTPLERLVRRRAWVELVEVWLGPDRASKFLSSRLPLETVLVDAAAECC